MTRLLWRTELLFRPKNRKEISRLDNQLTADAKATRQDETYAGMGRAYPAYQLRPGPPMGTPDPDRHGPEGGIVIVLALFMIVGLLAGILWALWPSAQRSGYDPGGSILKYAAEADRFTGPLPGYCASACTLYLLRGCVQPETSLVFHLPSVDHEYWRGLMASHYPPAIAAWFLSLPPDSPAIQMTSAEAVRLGAAAC